MHTFHSAIRERLIRDGWHVNEEFEELVTAAAEAAETVHEELIADFFTEL